MFQKHTQITIILLILVFTGTNLVSGLRMDPVAEKMSQPAGESSQDTEADKKMNDDQDKSCSFLLATRFCTIEPVSGILNVNIQSDHTLEVILPPSRNIWRLKRLYQSLLILITHNFIISVLLLKQNRSFNFPINSKFHHDILFQRNKK